MGKRGNRDQRAIATTYSTYFPAAEKKIRSKSTGNFAKSAGIGRC
jgi:hypothetical protein